MKHKLKRIAILLPDLAGGGAERLSIDLAHEFTRAGHDVEFVLMRMDGELLPEAHESFSVVDLGTPRARQLALPLARYLRHAQPDALLVGIWPLTTIAALVARISGFRGNVTVSEHGILSAQYMTWGKAHRMALRASMAMGYRLADARIGVSVGVVRDIALLAKMPESDFQVVNNPVAPRPKPDLQVLAEIDARWGVPPGARILTVGSFKPVKNHPLLLRAFAKLIQNRTEARLIFLGAGDGETKLRTMAHELGISEQVIFAGFHNDPTSFYCTADLFVLSSDYEGFGNVIVEALACGTPVVSTDCPSGPAEILQDGRYGALVPVGDATALADAMETSLGRVHDANRLIQRAQAFEPHIAAEKYLDLMFPTKKREASGPQ